MEGSQTNVVYPFLPPLEDYVKKLKNIWASGQLSNNGPEVIEFEKKNS